MSSAWHREGSQRHPMMHTSQYTPVILLPAQEDVSGQWLFLEFGVGLYWHMHSLSLSDLYL